MGVEMQNETDQGEVSPKETLVIFLIVLAIIPWAVIWMNYLAPAVGLGGLSWKQQVIFIVGGPALVWWGISLLFFRKD